MSDQLVNLNNAGASKPADGVIDAITNHLQQEDKLGGYEAAGRSGQQSRHTYDAIGALINCDAADIAYMDSASRAWNCFLYSLKLGPGDVILSARTEFGTNIVSLGHFAARVGASVSVVESDDCGRIDMADFNRKFNDQVSLVAISQVPMHRGVVNPVEAIGAAVADQGKAIYLVDACQSAGQIPVDVKQIGCHALTGTGRKWLRGPRGTGFLYVNEDIANTVDPLTVDLATAELMGDIEQDYRMRVIESARRFETWERSVANVIGLGVAIDQYLKAGPISVQNEITVRAERIREGLLERGHSVYETNPKLETGIVTFSPRNGTADEFKTKLGTSGFAVSAAHVYDAPIDFRDRELASLVRVSPHAYNSEVELTEFLNALDTI